MAQPPNPRVATLQGRIAEYNRRHPNKSIDPQAALAVANQEGLSGRIGDGGHAFGDFQLNDAGGVLTHKFDGWTPERKQQWASSPQGIDFALGGIGGVAGGQRGEAAVRSIVSKFERPADIPGEIARALAGLGGAGAVPPSPAPAAASSLSTALTAQAPSQDARRQFAAQLLAGLSPTGQLNQGALFGALAQRRQTMQAPPVQPLPAVQGQQAPTQTLPLTNQTASGGFAELLHEGVGGPTHSTGEHIHFAATDPQKELQAIRLAQSLGLSVRENPYTDPVDPVHAKNSYHYRTFPGKFNGRTLGQAADASGDRTAMLKLYKLLGGH